MEMPNVIETAKAATIAYNEKNWDKVKAAFTENGVYDEKGSGRRVRGIGQMLEAWRGWAQAIPDSKATVVAEYASGDTAVFEVVWSGTHTSQLQTGTIPPSNKRIEIPACQVMKTESGKVKRRAKFAIPSPQSVAQSRVRGPWSPVEAEDSGVGGVSRRRIDSPQRA